jgi:hypothetical protein
LSIASATAVCTLGPVRDPFHRHLPEHRGQAAGVTRLGVPPRDRVVADDSRQPFLPHRTKIQVVLL